MIAQIIFYLITLALIIVAISIIKDIIKSIINNRKWREAFRCGECQKIHTIPLSGVCDKCGAVLLDRQHNGRAIPTGNAERVVVRRRWFKREVKTCPHGYQVVGNCDECKD